jgi:hypothetical protein
MVLSAQKKILETMETKQKEDQRENDSRVKELMEKLTAVEMALTMERIRCLEFEAALTIERQNKRRAIDSPEDARGKKTRSTGPAQHVDHNSTPAINSLNPAATALRVPAQRVCPITGNRYNVLPTMSASGLPVSRKFNPPLIMSTRSKDRKPPQEMIDAMMAPPPIPSSQQIQPAKVPQADMVESRVEMVDSESTISTRDSTISACGTAAKSTTSDASAIQPSHHLLKDYHNRSRIPPHGGPHQPIRGCLEEKAARPRTLPTGIRNTQRGHACALFEAALLGVEGPLHNLVGELPKRRRPRGQA